MDIEVKEASYDIRGEVSVFVKEASEAQASKKRAGVSIKMNVDIASVMGFFDTACMHDNVFFGVLYLEHQIAGFVIIQEIWMPKVKEGKVSHYPCAFIWNLYKTTMITDQSGFRRRVLTRGNAEFIEAMVNWAKGRDHKMLLGNCAPDFKINAAKMYGFETKHIVLGMDL